MTELSRALGLDRERREAARDAWILYFRTTLGVDAETALVMADLARSSNEELILPPGHFWDHLSGLTVVGHPDIAAMQTLLGIPIRRMNEVQMRAYEEGRGIVCPRGHAHGVLLEELASDFWRNVGENARPHTIQALDLDPATWDLMDSRVRSVGTEDRVQVLLDAQTQEHHNPLGKTIFQCNHTFLKGGCYWWVDDPRLSIDTM